MAIITVDGESDPENVGITLPMSICFSIYVGHARGQSIQWRVRCSILGVDAPADAFAGAGGDLPQTADHRSEPGVPRVSLSVEKSYNRPIEPGGYPDITYIPVQGGFSCLVAVMDWASRQVLAWRLSNTLDTCFCLEALADALEGCGIPEIFNEAVYLRELKDGLEAQRVMGRLKSRWRSGGGEPEQRPVASTKGRWPGNMERGLIHISTGSAPPLPPPV